MIHTTFRINVVTPPLVQEDLLGVETLATIFKSASASHEVNPRFGLPAPENEIGEKPAAQAAIDDDAVIKAAQTVDKAVEKVGEIADKAQSIGILNRQGRLITPDALDAYRETFVMRRSFGIPTAKRSNIDTSSKKLPKILPEDITKFFPTPSAEQLARAALSAPRTKRQIIDETLALSPQPLPSLALRVSMLHRPLWDRNDEVARHNWKKVLRPQLAECLYELQKDLMRLEVPSNISLEVKDELRFERLDVTFDKYIISVANKSTNRFGDVEEVVEQFYTLLNDRAFGDKEVIRVDAPFIDRGVVQAQNELKRQHYLQAAREKQAAEDEQARLQAEREQRWLEEAQQAQAVIDQVQSDIEKQRGETGQADAPAQQAQVEQAPAEQADRLEGEAAPGADGLTAAGEEDGPITVSPDGPNAAEGESAPAAAEGSESEPEADEPESHYQGASALLFSQQTIHETRLNELEALRARQEEEREREEALQAAAEQGIELLPELHDRVWGITFEDGTIAYFDTLENAFVEMPEPKPEPAEDAGTDDAADAANAAGDSEALAGPVADESPEARAAEDEAAEVVTIRPLADNFAILQESEAVA